MKDLEKIKSKINALLEKTTENGASKAEALQAISMAEKLMRKYSILKSELPEKQTKEKCVLVSHPKFKTAYKTEYFFNSLADLFDCEHYFTKSQITFFGYKEDVRLCIYFYDLIMNLCFTEKDKFFKSEEGLALKSHYNGRTLASNFIKGFLFEISKRLHEMYEAKKEESNQKERGVILVKKKSVDKQFSELNFNIKVDKIGTKVNEARSFLSGKQKGKEAQLQYAVENEQKQHFVMIS